MPNVVKYTINENNPEGLTRKSGYLDISSSLSHRTSDFDPTLHELTGAESEKGLDDNFELSQLLSDESTSSASTMARRSGMPNDIHRAFYSNGLLEENQFKYLGQPNGQPRWSGNYSSTSNTIYYSNKCRKISSWEEAHWMRSEKRNIGYSDRDNSSEYGDESTSCSSNSLNIYEDFLNTYFDQKKKCIKLQPIYVNARWTLSGKDLSTKSNDIHVNNSCFPHEYVFPEEIATHALFSSSPQKPENILSEKSKCINALPVQTNTHPSEHTEEFETHEEISPLMLFLHPSPFVLNTVFVAQKLSPRIDENCFKFTAAEVYNFIDEAAFVEKLDAIEYFLPTIEFIDEYNAIETNICYASVFKIEIRLASRVVDAIFKLTNDNNDLKSVYRCPIIFNESREIKRGSVSLSADKTVIRQNREREMTYDAIYRHNTGKRKTVIFPPIELYSIRFDADYIIQQSIHGQVPNSMKEKEKRNIDLIDLVSMPCIEVINEECQSRLDTSQSFMDSVSKQDDAGTENSENSRLCIYDEISSSLRDFEKNYSPNAENALNSVKITSSELSTDYNMHNAEIQLIYQKNLPISLKYKEIIDLTTKKLTKNDMQMKELEERCRQLEEKLRNIENYSDIYHMNLIYNHDTSFSLSGSQFEDVNEKSIKYDLLNSNRICLAYQSDSHQSDFEMMETDELSSDSSPQSCIASRRSRIFAELLSLVSRRNQLITYETKLVYDLKMLQLDQYQTALEYAYDSKYSTISDKADKQSKFKDKLRTFWHLGGSATVRSNRKQPQRSHSSLRDSLEVNKIDNETLLLDEMDNIAKRRKMLLEVQNRIFQSAKLQESSICEALNRHDGNFNSSFPPVSTSAKYSSVHLKKSAYGEAGRGARNFIRKIN